MKRGNQFIKSAAMNVLGSSFPLSFSKLSIFYMLYSFKFNPFEFYFAFLFLLLFSCLKARLSVNFIGYSNYFILLEGSGCLACYLSKLIFQMLRPSPISFSLSEALYYCGKINLFLFLSK